MTSSNLTSAQVLDGEPALLARAFGWSTLAFLVAFMINNILSIGFDIPSGKDLLTNPSFVNFLQPIVYIVCFSLTLFWVYSTPGNTLRRDATCITNFNTYFIRGCFFAVLLLES